MRWRYVLFVVLFVAGRVDAGDWHPFFDGAVFVTSATQTGPKQTQQKFFSTNWFDAGAERSIGTRMAILGRARFSLEPLTIPKEGYPQLFQYISPQSGGPLIDHQRAADLVQEVAAGFEWRPLQLYLAPIGEPPLGPERYAERQSSVDFAEAPFTYDIQESYHLATRVAALALTSRFIDVEYGVFHASQTTGRHSSIHDGNVDSWSARATIAPQGTLSAQISTGRLGDAKSEVDSASISYNRPVVSASAIWTKRDDLQSWSLETALRIARSTVVGRYELVDRPAGIYSADQKQTTHVTIGYIFDVLRRRAYRAGLGLNIDYHNATRALEPVYGHKPQNVFIFARIRTSDLTRPASP